MLSGLRVQYGRVDYFKFTPKTNKIALTVYHLYNLASNFQGEFYHNSGFCGIPFFEFLCEKYSLWLVPCFG